MSWNLFNNFISSISFISLLFLSFLLNYISTLYSEADLFKIDLSKEKKKIFSKKLIFILKNGELLSLIISFLQVFINTAISTVFVDKIENSLKKLNRIINILIINFFTAFFTEIFSRYLGNKKISKKIMRNHFLINFTYLIIKLFSFLQKIIKPREKIFVKSEKDIISFLYKLSLEGIIEKEEFHRVISAFNFDDLNIEYTPIEKVIFIYNDMKEKEIEEIFLKNLFTRYPVLDRETKEIMGILSIKIFCFNKNREFDWKENLKKKLVFIDSNSKLDNSLEKLKSNHYNLALVKEGKKIKGIITIQDIINSLMGEKLFDEKDKLININKRIN